MDIRKKVFCDKSLEALEQVSQRRSCHIPESVQGQDGWDLEQPGPVKDVPAHGEEFGSFCFMLMVFKFDIFIFTVEF